MEQPAPGQITVYGDLISGNCLKVKYVADKLGLRYRWVETSVLAGDTSSPAFLALNPAGQVPLMVLGDGRAIAQSNAIMVALAEGSPFIPTDPYERAKMFEWLFWEQYSHEPYIAVRRFQMHYLKKAESELDPKLKERGDAALARMQLALSGSECLAGDKVSLADVACLAYTRLSHEGGFDLSAYPAVQAWVARIEEGLGLAPAAR